MDPYHGLMKVHHACGKPGGDFPMINISNKCGIAHILPIVPSCGAESESWLVYSRVDLTTFNGIY